MADETDKKATEQRPEPGYKRFGGAKLVPPPAPIQQPNDTETFPVFLGIGIAVSILALITVFVLAFFSHKTKVNTPPAESPVAMQSATGAPKTSPAAKNPH